MAGSFAPYPPEFRRQMADLLRSGRTPEELALEFEPSAGAVRKWVRQADLEAEPAVIDVLKEKWVSVALLLGFVAAWALLFFFVSPEELVALLGVEQAYLVVFLLSVIGALLSMTTFSTYPAIVAFALGGMNLFGLVIAAGVGLTVGDRIFYALATRVKGLLSGQPRRWAVRLEEWLEERPRWQITGVAYVWVGLLPLANNVLTGALALGGYRFRAVLVPIFLGNLTFPAGVAWLATQGIKLYG